MPYCHPAKNRSFKSTLLAINIVCLFLFGSLSLQAQDNSRALLVVGVQADYGEAVTHSGVFGHFSSEDLCRNSDSLGWAMASLIDRVQSALVNAGSPITLDNLQNMPGAPTQPGIAAGLQSARDSLCGGEFAPTVQPFVIAYSPCRMAMVTPQNSMDMHLPPGEAKATMSMADFAERQVVYVDLNREFNAAASVLGTQWTNSVSMTGATDGGERIGFDTTRYNFEYSSSPGVSSVAGLFGASISVTNSGQVWVTDDAPGVGIVQSFYSNLTSEVSRDEASAGMFSGMIENLGGMLREGLPLEMESTVHSTIRGRTSVSGRSHMRVAGMEVVNTSPQWCSQNLMPPDYPVLDINQQIQHTMQSNGVDAEELNQAMQELNRAMEQMTPEQREMMERWGMSGAAAGSESGSASSAASAVGPAQAAPSAQGLSTALRSDNPTETVQNYLQALGYEPGDANGELSIETTIAISQYQAENNLEVTGEVSRQLTDRLATDIDRL